VHKKSSTKRTVAASGVWIGLPIDVGVFHLGFKIKGNKLTFKNMCTQKLPALWMRLDSKVKQERLCDLPQLQCSPFLALNLPLFCLVLQSGDNALQLQCGGYEL